MSEVPPGDHAKVNAPLPAELAQTDAFPDMQSIRTAIIAETNVPPYTVPPDLTPIDIPIVGSHHLLAPDGQPVELFPRQISLLNILRLLRNDVIIVGDIKTLDPKLVGPELQKAVGRLVTQFAARGLEDFVAKTGDRFYMEYALHPALRFIDALNPAYPQEPLTEQSSLPQSESSEAESRPIFAFPKLRRPTLSAGTETDTKEPAATETPADFLLEEDLGGVVEEVDVEKASRRSVEAVATVVRHYRDNAKLAVYLARNRAQTEAGPSSAMNAFQVNKWMAKQYEPLESIEDDRRMFAAIDAGIAVFQTLDKLTVPPDARQEQVLFDMVAAYDRLYGVALSEMAGSVRKRSYVVESMTAEDLFIEGTLAVRYAIAKFDETRDVRFAAYVQGWVRQRLSRAIYEQDAYVRLPVHVGETMRSIKSILRVLANQGNATPTYQEIADAYNAYTEKMELKREKMTVDKLKSLRGFQKLRPISLDPSPDDEERALGNIMPSRRNDVGRTEKTIALQQSIRALISAMPARKNRDNAQFLTVLALYYGLDPATFGDLQVETEAGMTSLSVLADVAHYNYGKGPLTFVQIAEMFGGEPERYAYMHRSALEILRRVAVPETDE